MTRRVVLLLCLTLAVAAWAGDIRLPPCGYWCQMFGGERIPLRRVAAPESYWLPRGVGVIAHNYDMAQAPHRWWSITNVMPSHAMLDDIAGHDIRIASLWIRTTPFDGTGRWCWDQWWPYSGYSGVEMCQGTDYVVDEDMDLMWTHPGIDVIVIRFEQWASLERRCDGSQGLIWENEPTKGIVDRLYELYADERKIIIFQNWEGDWQLNGTGCRDRDVCVPFSERQLTDCGVAGLTIEECCDEIKRDRGSVLLRTFNERQHAISGARREHQNANLKVYHSICINFYSDEPYTVAKDIIPMMDEPPDFVGVSFWKKPPISVTDALGYVEAHTGLPRYRIYVSELGGREGAIEEPYERIMREGTAAFEWGAPMVFVWHWKYWWDDVKQQELSLFEDDNETPKPGYWAVKELNDEWR